MTVKVEDLQKRHRPFGIDRGIGQSGPPMETHGNTPQSLRDVPDQAHRVVSSRYRDLADQFAAAPGQDRRAI
jgi:hypothetical protein